MTFSIFNAAKQRNILTYDFIYYGGSVVHGNSNGVYRINELMTEYMSRE